MKTITTRLATSLCLALSLACAGLATGDDSGQGQGLKTCKGITTAVDAREHTLKVKVLGFSRTFNVASNCKVSLQDKADASLEDLRPGQNVTVHYLSNKGVHIARQIDQHNTVFTGHVTGIDPKQRTLSVKGRGFGKNFTIANNCAVVLKDDKNASLTELKPGHTVQVVYEEVGGATIARRIEQQSDVFEGTIRAIDLTARTVKAKDLFREHKFNLANDCKIVIGGKLDGSLDDLRIGDRANFSYENKNGVLIATRIERLLNMPDPQPVASSQP